MNKNNIIIVHDNKVVEYMTSKIQTSADLRKRIAKHFPGYRKVYFKVNKEDSSKGCFFVNKQRYDWQIQPTKGSDKSNRGILTGKVLKPIFTL